MLFFGTRQEIGCNRATCRRRRQFKLIYIYISRGIPALQRLHCRSHAVDSHSCSVSQTAFLILPGNHIHRRSSSLHSRRARMLACMCSCFTLVSLLFRSCFALCRRALASLAHLAHYLHLRTAQNRNHNHLTLLRNVLIGLTTLALRVRTRCLILIFRAQRCAVFLYDVRHYCYTQPTS